MHVRVAGITSLLALEVGSYSRTAATVCEGDAEAGL